MVRWAVNFETFLEHAVHDLGASAMRPWDLLLQPLPHGTK
jgi:hypothetical protein